MARDKREMSLHPRLYLDCIKNGDIPSGPPSDLGSPFGTLGGTGIDMRGECIARGLWVVIDRIWTKALADWIGSRTVLEIMAGGGWIAKALNDYGITVTATDNFAWSEGSHPTHSRMQLVYPVQKMDALTACRESRCDVLLVSWPPYGDDAICRACEAWGEERPIIYIGEQIGCNAPEEFFDHFDEIDDMSRVPLKTWWGMHDRCLIGHYRVKGE